MNPEVLQQILQQQQQQFLAALQAMQVQAQPLPANAQPNPAPIDRLMQSLSLRLSEFVYDPDENDTFDRWYARYQDVFTADAEMISKARPSSRLHPASRLSPGYPFRIHRGQESAATIQGRIGSVLYSVRMNGHLHQVMYLKSADVRFLPQVYLHSRWIKASSWKSPKTSYSSAPCQFRRPRRSNTECLFYWATKVNTPFPDCLVFVSANHVPSFTPRRSDRLPKPRRFLMVDPKKKSYELEEYGSSL
uniref:DUF7083 domain-containing protein n=1 Tax=Ditylenchus dipsaci TaxID=166011 RepID=A0A915DPN1_9BILA